MIKKMHHIALRPTKENFKKTVDFYTQLLGFTVEKEWIWNNNGTQIPCVMIDTGNGVALEIFGSGQVEQGPIGAIAHLCFEVDNIETIMAKLKKAGFPATNAQGEVIDHVYTDLFMHEKNPRMIWRCAFVKGVCGELVEFFTDISDL